MKTNESHFEALSAMELMEIEGGIPPLVIYGAILLIGGIASLAIVDGVAEAKTGEYRCPCSQMPEPAVDSVNVARPAIR